MTKIDMQYFKPDAERCYFGDAMPFFDGTRFHLYYLPAVYDDAGNMRGHDWAHLSSADLNTWIEHPLALERGRHPSFGTGSIFQLDGKTIAFFSASIPGSPNTLVGRADSDDGGLTFRENEDARFPDEAAITALGYRPIQYRDPCVFRDPATGLFHMLVTSALQNGFDGVIYPFGACLAHLVSHDCLRWTLRPPFLRLGHRGAPECSDHFEWNGWYYLLYSQESITYYQMASTPLGPWRIPAHPVLTSGFERVMKTAAFHGNRRIGVAYIPETRKDGPQYGGRAVFRELVQAPDGTLGTAFVPELRTKKRTRLAGPQTVDLSSPAGFQAHALGAMPRRALLRMRIIPRGRVDEFGLLLGGQPFGEALQLAFVPAENRIELRDTMRRWPFCRGYVINHTRARDPLSGALDVEIVLHDTLIDVAINGRQCFLTALPEMDAPGHAFLFAVNTAVTFEMDFSKRFGDL